MTYINLYRDPDGNVITAQGEWGRGDKFPENYAEALDELKLMVIELGYEYVSTASTDANLHNFSLEVTGMKQQWDEAKSLFDIDVLDFTGEELLSAVAVMEERSNPHV